MRTYIVHWVVAVGPLRAPITALVGLSIISLKFFGEKSMTMTTVAADRVTLDLAGCMTTEQKADNDDRFHRDDESLAKAQARATITCDEANLCG